jgi:hypothetical protein
MSLLMMRRAGGAAAAGGGIASQALRWDAGTGSTVAEIIVPLQQGQLMPANLANVSVWVNGTERGVFLTTRGLWPDNSARVLYGKCTLTLTNGSPLTADVRLTGGFTEPRVSDTDMSARWITYTSGGEEWETNGFPAGVIVPTSAAHLCAASWLGPLTPQATQPTFTGVAAYEVAFDETLITNPLSWTTAKTAQGIAGAYYERGTLFVKKWMRTGDATYLRYGFSTMARWYGDWWLGQAGSVQENLYSYQDWSCIYMMRNDDTPWTTWVRPKAEGDGGSGNFAANDPAANNSEFTAPGYYGPRFFSGLPILQMWFGIVCGYGDRVVSGETWKQNADLWLGTLDISPFWDASKTWTITGFESDGTTPKRVVYLFQASVLASRILRLCEVLPASTNRTDALNQIRSTCDWMRTSGLAFSSPLSYQYATDQLFDNAGGRLTELATTRTVELNGLHVEMFAWKAWADADATSLAHAKDLIAPLGNTPRSGGANGPYIGEHDTSAKQWDEVFGPSQNALAYIALAGG